MACTETGLKTCERPAVFTLKPLRGEEEEEEEEEGVNEGHGSRRRVMVRDVNKEWTQLVHGTIQDSDQWNIPQA